MHLTKRASKCMNQELTDRKGEINKSLIKAGDFNMLSPVTVQTGRLSARIYKNWTPQQPNNRLYLNDSYRTLHSTQ